MGGCQVRGKKNENEKEKSKEKNGRQRDSKNVIKTVSFHLMMVMRMIIERNGHGMKEWKEK